jgi:hypothetical protein
VREKKLILFYRARLFALLLLRYSAARLIRCLARVPPEVDPICPLSFRGLRGMLQMMSKEEAKGQTVVVIVDFSRARIQAWVSCN